MKKQILLVLLFMALIMSCKSTGGATVSSFSDVLGKEWKLIEVQIDSTPINKIVLNNTGNVYTTNFNAEMVSGTGAPNKYSAPYTLGEMNSLKIGLIRSTLMASLIQQDKLQEHDFYTYMQNVVKWSMDNGKLVLHSKVENGNTVRLIFIL
ncbi:MAG: META domain-containing protein [Bacteroidetes bacterium]|nr:META domain-containing protein [Bacteroidota bacterium]